VAAKIGSNFVTMIRIAIFDDHRHRRDALKLMISLRTDMICTGDYANCNNLVADLRDNVPDVVLMDIDMPGINGIEGVKLLQQHYPATLIIMQTVFEEEDKIFNSLLAGAHGYILKNAPNDKMIEGILDVVNGGAPMTPSIARQVLTYFNKRPNKATKEEFNLSKREMELLDLLVKGYSHKMIAAELFISINTVNNHIKKIYEKLHVHSVSEAVSTAIKKNIV
jgi:DNA-binding NarL/FixJ family response regulator